MAEVVGGMVEMLTGEEGTLEYWTEVVSEMMVGKVGGAEEW